jgi:lipid II:glycine glycyltransferase (peptidoglycan interpeptide bridge formation enzyme)
MNHPLQSIDWGNFREKTGVKVVRKDGVLLTIHKVPNTPWKIGYLPKGEMPTMELIGKLKEIGREEKCIFIQLEPDVIFKTYPSRANAASNTSTSLSEDKKEFEKLGLVKSAHPLFTKYTFVLDISKPEEELLKNMHSKTRYNIRVAQKNNVEVVEDNSDEAFHEYLKLTHATTTRQKFYAHTDKYHRTQWELLPHTHTPDKLSSHLLLAKYNGKVLVAWIVFVFKDTLYYPYGASGSEHREVMASNLMMWEVIKFGKKLGLKKFDMWGALGPYPDTKDPWFGFHRFKQGYGGDLVEFVGSYDLVIDPFLYQAYKVADKARWLYLRMRK